MKTTKNAQRYAVVVFGNGYTQDSNGTWRAEIARDCGHSHRTIGGAYRCYRQLTKRLSDGMYSAAWHNAQIRHADGSYLTDEESFELNGYQIAEYA